MALRLRPTRRALTNPPPLTHLFSSSSSDPSDPSDPSESKPDSSSSLSNYFKDVKATLRHQPTTTPPPPSGPTKSASLAEIRKNLAGFRARSTEPKPTEPPPTPVNFSFQEHYKKNVSSGKVVEFKSIRESLKLMKPSGGDSEETKGEALSFKRLRNIVGSKDVGKEGLPSLFDKEREREGGMGEKREGVLKIEFVRSYSYEELGDRLRKLRRDEEGKEEFSLGELSERLVKLRQMEGIENQQRSAGVGYEDLRQSLVNLKFSEDEKAKKDTSE